MYSFKQALVSSPYPQYCFAKRLRHCYSLYSLCCRLLQDYTVLTNQSQKNAKDTHMYICTRDLSYVHASKIPQSVCTECFIVRFNLRIQQNQICVHVNWAQDMDLTLIAECITVKQKMAADAIPEVTYPYTKRSRSSKK